MKKNNLIGYVSTRDLKTVTEDNAKALDSINIAFGHVNNHQIVWEVGDAKQQIKRLRTINPNLKFLLSIGGWSAGGFSQMASTQEHRQIFSDSALKWIQDYDLDGIDLDWEYPCFKVAGIEGSGEDKRNFTYLLKTLRETLDTVNKRYLLTIAAGGGAYYLKGVEAKEIIKYLDYIQLMTYDLRGGFQVLTGHHTNLYEPEFDLFEGSVDTAVKHFTQAGIPLEKLVIGVAFYSRMWKGVPNVDCGYLQMAQTVGTYGPSYGKLVAEYINQKGYQRYWDDQCKAPYLFNGDTFISYDDEESITHKIKYMNEKGLYGVMYWEYCTDETHTLTRFMGEAIQKIQG